MSIDNSIQVVLIDDDPHLRQALCQTLDLAGLKVLPLGEANGLTARLSRDWPGVVVSPTIPIVTKRIAITGLLVTSA